MTTNKDLFAKTYAESFKEVYPGLPVERTQVLIEKALSTALENIRAVLIDGSAFKLTSKKLGIKHTYKDIETFLNT